MPVKRERHVVVDRLLHRIQEGRGGSRRDAVHVAVERPGQAGKDDVLNTGHLQELEAHGCFVGAVAALQLLLDSVAVVVVALVVAAAHYPVAVGDQQGSECGLRVLDVAAPVVEDPGGGVGRAARRGGVGADILLGISRLQGEQCVGHEDRPRARGGHDQRAGRDRDRLAAVDVAELLTPGGIELEVVIALGDAGHLCSQAVDAEDLADEVEVLSGGVVDQRLPEVQELVGFHLPDLVADNVAEGSRQ